MTQISLNLANRRCIEFEVSCGLGGPAFFVLSIRKCGSTIFNKICRSIADVNGHRFVHVGDTFFWNNVDVGDYVNDPALLDLVRPGNVYGGFRDMPTILVNSELFRTSPKLLMVRDPRDALVSEFFSIAYSHPLPEGGGTDVTQMLLKQRELALQSGIDATAIRRASLMSKTMLDYASILGFEQTTVLTYEKYILDKPSLVRAVGRAFGWRIDDEQVSRIDSWADIHPVKEDPTAFVRHVTPGDHLEKLKPATIATINEILRPAMELFGYSR